GRPRRRICGARWTRSSGWSRSRARTLRCWPRRSGSVTPTHCTPRRPRRTVPCSAIPRTGPTRGRTRSPCSVSRARRWTAWPRTTRIWAAWPAGCPRSPTWPPTSPPTWPRTWSRWTAIRHGWRRCRNAGPSGPGSSAPTGAGRRAGRPAAREGAPGTAPGPDTVAPPGTSPADADPAAAAGAAQPAEAAPAAGTAQPAEAAPAVPGLASVLAWAQQAQHRLAELSGDDDRIGTLGEEEARLAETVRDLGGKLTSLRKDAADRFSAAVTAGPAAPAPP